MGGGGSSGGGGGPSAEQLAAKQKADDEARVLQEKNDIQRQRDALTAKGRAAEVAGRSFLKASGVDQDALVKKSLLGGGISG